MFHIQYSKTKKNTEKAHLLFSESDFHLYDILSGLNQTYLYTVGLTVDLVLFFELAEFTVKMS